MHHQVYVAKSKDLYRQSHMDGLACNCSDCRAEMCMQVNDLFNVAPTDCASNSFGSLCGSRFSSTAAQQLRGRSQLPVVLDVEFGDVGDERTKSAAAMQSVHVL